MLGCSIIDAVASISDKTSIAAATMAIHGDGAVQAGNTLNQADYLLRTSMNLLLAS
jgi:hypothetical protein